MPNHRRYVDPSVFPAGFHIVLSDGEGMLHLHGKPAMSVRRSFYHFLACMRETPTHALMPQAWELEFSLTAAIGYAAWVVTSKPRGEARKGMLARNPIARVAVTKNPLNLSA